MTDTHVSPQLLGIKLAAERSGLSERHLRDLTYAHKVPFVRVGRRIYFRVVDLDRWVEQLAEDASQ